MKSAPEEEGIIPSAGEAAMNAHEKSTRRHSALKNDAVTMLVACDEM